MSDQLLRLAFVTYEFPPVVDGGAGTYAGALVAELVALGHDVSVFAPDGAIVPSGASFVPVSTASGGFWRHLPGAVSAAARSVGPFDLVHGNGVADMALRRPRSTARVVTLHHRTGQAAWLGWRDILPRLLDVRGKTGILLPIIERHVLRRADRVIAVSDLTARDAVDRLGVARWRVDVIPNGVATRHTAPRPPQAAQSGPPMIMAVGRLEGPKGTDLLLKAFASMDPALGARLVMVGRGPTTLYAQLARSLGVADRVEMPGWVDGPQLENLYEAATVVVSASRLEGFGLVLLEGMAHGRPIVATRTGIAADGVIDERAGAVVDVEDPAALASALEEILRDPVRAQRTGRENRERVLRDFSWRTTAERTVETYRAALAQVLDVRSAADRTS